MVLNLASLGHEQPPRQSKNRKSASTLSISDATPPRSRPCVVARCCNHALNVIVGAHPEGGLERARSWPEFARIPSGWEPMSFRLIAGVFFQVIESIHSILRRLRDHPE